MKPERHPIEPHSPDVSQCGQKYKAAESVLACVVESQQPSAGLGSLLNIPRLKRRKTGGKKFDQPRWGEKRCGVKTMSRRRADVGMRSVCLAAFLQLILLEQCAPAFQGCSRALPLGKAAGAAAALRSAGLCDSNPGAQHRSVALRPSLQRERHGLLATRSAIDFDSVRGSVREIIFLGSGALGLAVIGNLLATAATGGIKGNPLTAEEFFKWARGVTPEEWQKLAICLLLDVAGVAPEFLVPGPAGEALDAAWAPLYAAILFGLFGSRPLLYKVRMCAMMLDSRVVRRSRILDASMVASNGGIACL